MSHINFVRISGRVITADYDLPANSVVVIVNKTTGQTLASPVTQVPAAPTGSLTITVPASVRGGDYYLKAQDSAGGYIAQSIGFHVAVT